MKNQKEHKTMKETIKPSEIHETAAAILPPEDIDHHASDLYIRVTPQSQALIQRLEPKSLISTFIDNIERVRWYELPFCYNPEIAKND